MVVRSAYIRSVLPTIFVEISLDLLVLKEQLLIKYNVSYVA
jgi:hypothetical protein